MSNISAHLRSWSTVNYTNRIPVCLEKSGNCTRLLESHSLGKYAGRTNTLFMSINYVLLSSTKWNLTYYRVLAHSEVDVFKWSLATYEELANHFHMCVEQQIFSRLDALVYQEEEQSFNLKMTIAYLMAGYNTENSTACFIKHYSLFCIRVKIRFH